MIKDIEIQCKASGVTRIDGLWQNDLVFTESIADYNAGDSIYDEGWVIWSGNDDSIATDVSDVTAAAEYHVKDGDIPVNVNDPHTQLDTNGVIEVTSSGYTETALSGETLIGPFQKWMKQYGGSGTTERKSGQWVHMLRNFECSDTNSYVTVSYDFIYCLESTTSNPRHWSSLWITGDGGTDEYDLYFNSDYNDERLPTDAVSAGIDGAYRITADSGSNLLTTCNPSNGFPINVIPVSHQYTLGTVSSPFQLQFRNRMVEEEGWFMIKDIEISCSSTPAPSTSQPTTADPTTASPTTSAPPVLTPSPTEDTGNSITPGLF